MSSGVVKDFYQVLNVQRTATTNEVKEAYRKLALVFHPDRNDGCEKKASRFKAVSEAYQTLSDRRSRSTYDKITFSFKTKQRKSTTSKNYRKVYSPQAPPGFKTFDPKRHYDMHYGDGMMKEEIDRARKRAERASSRYNYGYEYDSPLGEGFTFNGKQGGNPHSRRRSRPPNAQSSSNSSNSNGDSNNPNNIQYEESKYHEPSGYNIFGSSSSSNQMTDKECAILRMKQRRKIRQERQKYDETNKHHIDDDSACIIM